MYGSPCTSATIVTQSHGHILVSHIANMHVVLMFVIMLHACYMHEKRPKFMVHECYMHLGYLIETVTFLPIVHLKCS